jgi:hypothetical protein
MRVVNSGVLSEVAGTGGWPELGGVDIVRLGACSSLPMIARNILDFTHTVLCSCMTRV